MRNTIKSPANIIFYFISPFFHFLWELKRYNNPGFKNVLWLFIIFFGYSMSFVDTIDAYMYVTKFQDIAHRLKNISSFLDIFNYKITNSIDFIVPLINYSVSLFTDDYHVMFGVYGLVFGYFYSRNIDFVLRFVNTPETKLLIGLVIYCASYIGFWQINGFRFWTATHIFVFGVLQHVVYKNKKGIIFILLSVATHYAFIIPLLLFLGRRVVPVFYKPYILLIFVLAIYHPFKDVYAVRNNLIQYAGYHELVERKLDSYTSEEAVIKASLASVRVNTFKIFSKLYSLSFILLLAFLISNKLKLVSKSDIVIFQLGIILSFAGSILSFIPSMGRFTMVGFLILLLSSTTILVKHGFYMKYFKVFSILGFLAVILIPLTEVWIFSAFSIHTFLGNYITVILDKNEVLYSIFDLLKEVLI